MNSSLILLRVTVGLGLQRGLGALLPLVLAAIATREQGLAAAAIVGVATAIALTAVAVTDLASRPPRCVTLPWHPLRAPNSCAS